MKLATGRARAALAGIAVTGAVILGMQVAAASTGSIITVDSTTDAVDARVGDGACRTLSGACTLRAAIQEANAHPGADAIDVPAGTYALGIPPLNENDVWTGDLDITDSLAIRGAGAGSTVIDAGTPLAGAPQQVPGLDRLFEVSVDGGGVSFSGLTISDGYAAEYGGAIMNNSTATVTVSEVALTGNVAGKTGGAIDNHVGGAVDVRDSTVSRNFASEAGSALNNNRDGSLTVTNSAISDNSAAAVGLDEALVGAGAIANNAELDARGTITVTDSEMSGNRAGGGRSGATISNDGAGSVTVTRTTVSKNHATGHGGAIFNGAGDVTVTDSAFSENAATDGGAVYNSATDGRMTVSGSTFSLNAASGRGGAIASGGTGVLTVLDSTFTKNSADDWGGAVLNDDKGSATIVDSTFRENSGLNGGGFANEGTGLVTVERSSFTKNSTFANLALVGGEGGGMHSNSVGDVVITGGDFTDNRAASGGGLSNEGGGQLTVTGTRFSGNTADGEGGGILIQSGAVRMRDVDVVGNVSDSELEGGGGIAYAGDKLLSIGESAAIEHSRIRDNKAKGEGGGIDSRGDGPLAVTTTAITGNTAGVGGGIHHVGDAPLDVTHSTLSGNFAEHGGGVFTDGDGETGIENSTLSGNRAGMFGGGALVSSRLTIRSSTVAENSAAAGGGINNGGGDLVGDGSVFVANTIVANSPTGGNCAGTMTSRGGNVDSGDSCRFRQVSDQPGTDPLLGPLAGNGGPTQTHALLAGSPAQERAVCTELDPCPPVDQRGVERPLFVGVDVGAYESPLTPEEAPSQPCSGRTERPVAADFDSWISQSTPGGNGGVDATLEVRSSVNANERALVHFDLPPLPPGCKLVGATLRLFAASATDGRTLETLRVTSAWDETGVTWANQPATEGPAATSESGLGVREWNVLPQALDMYALGGHGFLLRDAAENQSGEQSFHSREKGPEQPPVLVLVFDDPDAPPRPGSCPTSPQILSADRDSWVSEASPSNNSGSDSTLKVKSQAGSDSRAVVGFPLPDLPDGCTSVASATLRMEAASAKEGRTLQALRAASAWSESGVTWTNQPQASGPAATTTSAQGPLEWNVTPQVLDMYVSGNHGLVIRDADENGIGDEQALNSREKINDGPPELVLAFDDSTPETTIDAGPPSPTEETETRFVFSSDRDDATFECSLDGSEYQACTSPHTVGGLAEGGHSFAVRATRKVRAVDPTPATYDWIVAIPPETAIDSGPESPSPSSTATLTFSSDDRDATFECSLNGEPFAACTSPVGYTNLADGPHEVRVRAVDPFGSVDPTPAGHAWTVADPPAATIDSGPPDPTNSATAAFAFSADEAATFECRLDGGEWAACASGHEYRGLADGRHSFEVRATDLAGNVDPEPAIHAWTVDTRAPETTVDSGPPELTNEPSAELAFSANEEATFECRLDAGEWASCTSPVEFKALADGRHEVSVRATDGAGNHEAEPALHAWTVDTRAPETAIHSGPADPTSQRSARFEFGADETASFECRLDAGAWEPCTSGREYLELADGGHTLSVQATDGAGNREADPASYSWTVDTVAPETTIDSAPADPSNERSPAFAFSAEEAATFECRLDAGAWEACATGHGYLDLADGRHAFEVRATDLAGNADATPASHAWTVDTVAPETTIESGPDDPTNERTATVAFGADEAATFECRLDAGEWTLCTSPVQYGELADGRHTVGVRATDRAGNAEPAPAVHQWTVDTVAPETTIDSGPDDPTNRRSATFTFSAVEAASFECRLDAGAWEACASGHEYRDLADGSHEVQIRATDPAGNVEATPASHAWTVDTVAPGTTIDAAPADPTNERAARFAFSANEAGASFECRLDAGPWEACAGGREYVELADGRHTFSVQATDGAGNREADPASHSWTVDTVAPETTIDSGPPELTNSASASFAFSGELGASFECRLDAGAWVACASGHEYRELADGLHNVAVRATDAAGNVDPTPATYAWTVDTRAPATTVDSGPADPTRDRAASLAFSADEADASFECRLDAGDWVACTSPVALDNLADGRHAIAVRATDLAGNVDETPATYAWTVDTVAPQTAIDAGPRDPSNDRTATLRFSAGEAATFECRLDAGEWLACASPVDYVNLADGRHEVAVRATDLAGNVDETPASHAWTVDTVAPETTIESGPPELTNSASASFAFGAEAGATFECRLDGGAWAPCASGQGYRDLAGGPHSFAVRATDAAGNADPTPATYAWTVDTRAPATTVDSGPADPTRDRAASLAFSADEADASFECRLDAGDWVACTSPVALDNLADGRHAIAVRATDLAGNVDETPATYAWTVDTVAPQTAIDAGPRDPSNDRTASLRFSADEAAAFECRLDAGAWAACTSPVEYANLADGSHEVAVRAADRAGNVDETPASYGWTIDTVAPETTIESGPPELTNSASASFTFSGELGATFECRLDEGPWTACASGHEYRELADGPHGFAVRAIDAAGNADPTAATDDWTVDTVAPEATIDSGPDDPTNRRSATLTFSADEAASFECRLDAGEWLACTSSRGYLDLADGRHTFSVRATDPAGNREIDPASYSWTVDTVAPETTIDSAPADPSNNRSPAFVFGADETAAFECRLDEGAWVPCISGHGYMDLADGPHSFAVRATDAAGNLELTPATYKWTIDTVAPETTIDSGPPEPTNSVSASVAFSAEPGASFECRLDAGDWVACTSPVQYANLADGRHEVRVRATDPAGNTDATPAVHAWTVDTTAPDTELAERPPASTTSTSARFTFSAGEAATFECALDAEPYASCTSPREYSGLAAGEHEFRVRATDAAGNTEQSPASHRWTVEAETPRDTTAPDTTITSRPADPTSSTSATFGFTGSDDQATQAQIVFECRLDSVAETDLRSCSSNATYTGLGDGSHTFEVRAIDPAGNADPTPATYTWTVDATAPQTAIDSGPAAQTESTRATFTFSADEAASSFECSLDGAAFAACTSPREYSGLGAGSHGFSVRATDRAGNTDPTPATHTWIVSAPPDCGSQTTVAAAADAWVDENSPTNNKGDDSILKVQSKGPRDNFRALVRFSLPGVPEGCAVESATLRLYAASAKTGRTLQALRLTAAWTESQVTWSNQPQTTGSAASATSGQGYRDWNVGSQVQAMYAGANHGFLIRDAVEGQDAEQQFHAREKGQNAPQLVLVFAPVVAESASVSAVAARIQPGGRAAGRDVVATPVTLAGGTRQVRIAGGRASLVLPLSCPLPESGGCKGTVTMVSTRPRIGGTRFHPRIGSAAFDLRTGERELVQIRLRHRIARLVSGRTLAARARTVSRDAAGNAARRSVAMTLRFPGPR